MVSLLQSLAVAAAAFSSFVQGTPVTKVQRDVGPVADPVVVDTAGIYMRTTVLDDGTLIGGYAAMADDVTRELRVVKSTDNGDSWEQIGVVDSAPNETREIDNAFPFALSDGRILYAFRNHDKADKDHYITYRITLCVSEDGGVTWSFLTQIDERPVGSDKNGLWEPFLRYAADGSTIQAYYSAENSSADQDNLMRTSTDGGATWSDAITVSGGDIDDSRDGMIGVTDMGDGNLIAVFENTELGRFSVNYVLSSDDGNTWGSRGNVYTAADNADAGSPQVINVGGTLVASFMSNEAGGETGVVDGGEFKIVTSTDGGATWSGATTISANAHWPGLQVMDDTTFLALYKTDDLLSQMLGI